MKTTHHGGHAGRPQTASSHSPLAASPRLPSLLLALSCSLGVLMAPAAHAQSANANDAAQQPADTPSATATGRHAQLPTVSVRDQQESPNGRLDMDIPNLAGSRLGLTERETPASVTVVDRATIEARGARDTHDILHSMPGVSTSATPGDTQVRQRGFGSASVNQTYNGINLQYTIATQPVDSWIYERVEDIAGPSSFLYGAGGVGGTINYVTKTAQRRDSSEVQVGLGSRSKRQAAFGLNRRIAGDGNGQGDHYWRIDVNHERGGEVTDDTREHSSQVLTSLLSDLGGGLTHTLAYEHQRTRAHRPYWGTPLNQPATGELNVLERLRYKNYNSADGMFAQRVQWLRSVTEWKASNALSLKNTFYAYDALRDYRNVEIYELNAAGTEVTRTSPLLQRHDQRVYGNRIDGTLRQDLGSHRSDWSFGLDVSFNRQTTYPSYNDDFKSVVDPDRFVTEYFYDIEGIPSRYDPKNRHRVDTVAAYLENRTELTPTIKLITALRHERVKLHYTSWDDADAVDERDISRTYHPTTGRIGATWDISPQVMVYAQYATAADPASGNLASAYFSTLSDNTKLTTGRQLEIGSKVGFLDGRGNATVALFDIERKNIATSDPQKPRERLLIGKQRARGVELKAGLQLTRQWSVQGNATYTDAEYRNFYQGGVSLAGKAPTNTPSTIANLWSTYALTPNLSVNATLRHVSRLYANAQNTAYWPAATLVDLGLEYRINRQMTLNAHLDNVADKVYAEDVDDRLAVLGDPRTVFVSLKMQF